MRLTRQSSVRAAGFTLMELMVVLVLVAVISAVTIPAMKGTYEDAILRATSRDLAGAFDIATSRAITVGLTHRIRFDRKAGRYLLEKPARGARGDHDYVPVRDVPGADGRIDARIAIEVRRSGEAQQSGFDPAAATDGGSGTGSISAEDGISFYPDGTADGGEVRLEDRNGFRLTLRINPVTARVRILEAEHK